MENKTPPLLKLAARTDALGILTEIELIKRALTRRDQLRKKYAIERRKQVDSIADELRGHIKNLSKRIRTLECGSTTLSNQAVLETLDQFDTEFRDRLGDLARQIDELRQQLQTRRD